MQRLDRASAAVPNAMHVLPDTGEPLKRPQSPNSKMPHAWASARFERMVERVHALGVRPLAEMLAEIAAATGRPDIVADRIEAYARLDVDFLRFLGGDKFLPNVFGVVR